MNYKKYFALFLYILTVILTTGLKSSENLDFTIEVTDLSNGRIDILITINSGDPDFIFSLWDGEPWENGSEIENSGKTNSLNYTFRNVIRKSYFVMVTDNGGLRRVKQIQLNAKSLIRADKLRLLNSY